MRMTKTVLIASSLLLLGCPGDDSSDDTMAMTMSTSSPGTGTTTQDPDTGDSSGSDESGAACPDDSLSHATDIQPIWDANCVAACHEAGGFWPSLDLTDGHAGLVDATGVQTQTANLDDLFMVTPGDPELSYVLYKLRGDHVDLFDDPLIAANQMPVESDGMGGYNTLPAIPDADIQLVEDWILCGAPE